MYFNFFYVNAVRIFLQSLFKFEGGVGRKMEDPKFFLSRIWGALNCEKTFFFFFLGGGVFLNSSKKLSCAIFWNFFKPLKGCPKNMNAIKLGSGIFFCMVNIFSSMPPTPPPPFSDLNSVWCLICYCYTVASLATR